MHDTAGLPVPQFRKPEFDPENTHHSYVVMAHLKFDIQVQDNQDGTYTCTYSTNKAGSYFVNVSLNGKPLFAFYSRTNDLRPS